MKLKPSLQSSLLVDAQSSFPQFAPRTHSKIAELGARLLSFILSRTNIQVDEKNRVIESSLWTNIYSLDLNNKFVFRAQGKFYNYNTIMTFLLHKRYLIFKEEQGRLGTYKTYRINLDCVDLELEYPSLPERVDYEWILSKLETGSKHNVRCVYEIINTITGVSYIGSTSCLLTRFARHQSNLNNGNHYSERLQKDWDLFGHEFFQVAILEMVEREEDLVEREQDWMDRRLNPMYNKINAVASDKRKKACIND